jgi:uncharacterized protein with PIN domain
MDRYDCTDSGQATPSPLGSACAGFRRFQLRVRSVIARGRPPNDAVAVTTNRIKVRDDFPAAPICPHCDKEIQEMAARRVESMLGVRFVYYCTACRKVLGVSHRKGFWMG